MGNSFDKAAELQIVVIGDDKAGKTALISRLVANSATKNQYAVYLYSDNKQVHLSVDGRNTVIGVDELNTNDLTSVIAQQHIATANAFLLVYDVTSRKSFEAVTKAYDAIAKAGSNAPVVLAGLKCDSNDREVFTEEGNQLANTRGFKYIETSAKDNVRVDEAFQETVRQASAAKNPGSTTSK